MHNREILVVVVTIHLQPTQYKFVSLKQKMNERWILLTGKGEDINLTSWADVCKVKKQVNYLVLHLVKASYNC
jgi:hypothetical protein